MRTLFLSENFLPGLLLFLAVQFGMAGNASGDLVVNVEENTVDGTIEFSYTGTLDVGGLGTPTTGSFVPYIFSPGGAGDGGVTFGNSPLSPDLDIYEMDNLVPIAGTTMGAGTFTGSFSGVTVVSSSGDDFVFDDGLTPTILAVEQGFLSGTVAGNVTIEGAFADFGINHGFEDVVYALPNSVGDTLTFRTSSVPEPSSFAILGLACTGVFRRRR